MKKTVFSIVTMALMALSFNACSISALKPEPVPLATSDTAHFVIDNSAIPAEGSVCGEKYKEFDKTLRNGFNYAANAGENASVVNDSISQSKLAIRSIDMSCIGKDKVKGHIISAKVSYSWKVADGPETVWDANVVGASEGSAEKALHNLVTDMYNVIFSNYLTQNVK